MEDKREPLPSDSPVRPDGTAFKCNMSRHIGDYRLYAVWQIMAAFAGGTNRKSWCSAESERLADAIGCSRNFILWAQKQMVKRGLLVIQRAAYRLENGQWNPAVYSFAQHNDYKDYQPCPPYQFDEKRRTTRPPQKNARKLQKGPSKHV